MNGLLVHSTALVVCAKWKGIRRGTAQLNQRTNAVTAAKRVGDFQRPVPPCPPANRVTGHMAQECKNPHAFDWTGVPDLTPDNAWKALKKADTERDLDDIRQVKLETILDSVLALLNLVSGLEGLLQSSARFHILRTRGSISWYGIWYLFDR